ncbi:MAG: Beta-lactamase precursor [Pseudomonadota bacterium]|jgi:glyoxylase-like metal-dependent hydrolase (beta-lactamase superfamily II)
MDHTTDRRKFLVNGLGAVAAAALPIRGAQAAAQPAPVVTRLADHLLLITGAGGNIVAARDGEGLVLVDGGSREAGPAALQLALRTLGARRAHTLINTHWHADRTGLNETLGKAGARILAHANTALWLSTDVRYTPDGAPVKRLPAIARPTATTYGSGHIALGDEELRYGYLSQAHTDGDLYVKFVKANVLVTGGVVAGDGWPTADWVTGGWITGTANGYRTLIDQCDEQTRVVTASGRTLVGRQDLEAERAILADLSTRLTQMLRKGYAPADMLAARPAREHEARYGDATVFLTESFRSLWPRVAPDA